MRHQSIWQLYAILKPKSRCKLSSPNPSTATLTGHPQEQLTTSTLPEHAVKPGKTFSLSTLPTPISLSFLPAIILQYVCGTTALGDNPFGWQPFLHRKSSIKV
ncbi:hypothetical protein ATANTOWER_007104 [Ataeniobius toweri]|uniref:Uncharacterized protein n=1 Tax=Ataeniobius toweri TaxID=208326 RepID=A0ABU7BNW4_9TELE|nr:hypothetical protein [Ataeniobius toweri]